MSEKLQHTAATMRETMQNRYGEEINSSLRSKHKKGLHHKHNKCRLAYRAHWPSHPAYTVQLVNGQDQIKEVNESTGIIRKRNSEKIRKKRFDNRIIH